MSFLPRALTVIRTQIPLLRSLDQARYAARSAGANAATAESSARMADAAEELLTLARRTSRRRRSLPPRP